MKRSIGESPLLSRHPAGHGAPGRATLHGVTSELSFRDPYPLLHINCKQDTIEQGQPEVTFGNILCLAFGLLVPNECCFVAHIELFIEVGKTEKVPKSSTY